MFVSRASFISLDYFIVSPAAKLSVALAVCIHCSRLEFRYPLGNPTFGTVHRTDTVIALSLKFLKGYVHPDEDIFDC